jgi:hypothetical protein
MLSLLMFLLHLAAFLALAVIGRVVFLLVAPAMRNCRWCDADSTWCLRCHGTRKHFRLGTRLVARGREAVVSSFRELFEEQEDGK